MSIKDYLFKPETADAIEAIKKSDLPPPVKLAELMKIEGLYHTPINRHMLAIFGILIIGGFLLSLILYLFYLVMQ